MRNTVDAGLAARLCRQATPGHPGPAVLAVPADPLDGTVWVQAGSPGRPRHLAPRILHTSRGTIRHHLTPTPRPAAAAAAGR